MRIETESGGSRGRLARIKLVAGDPIFPTPTSEATMAMDRDDDRDDRYARDDRDDRDRFDSRDLEDARSKVKGPAIALMVTAVISLLLTAYSAFSYFVTMKSDFEAQRAKIDADPNMSAQAKRDMKEMLDTIEKIAAVALPVDWLIVIAASLVIFVGALKMKNLSGSGWARAGAILAMIPCVSGCCLLGLPFGIWALMVLSNRDVKRAFAQTASKSERIDEDFR